MLAVTEGKQLLRKAKTIVEKIHQAKEKQERDNMAAGIRTEEYEDKVWRIYLLRYASPLWLLRLYLHDAAPPSLTVHVSCSCLINMKSHEQTSLFLNLSPLPSSALHDLCTAVLVASSSPASLTLCEQNAVLCGRHPLEFTL